MTATAFAEPSDVAAVWRPLTAEEETVARGLIEQASAKLRVRVPSIDETLEAADYAGQKFELAKAAVVNAVKRVMQNPEGVLSTSYAIDDYREDNRRDAAQSTGLLYIDPDDLIGLVGRRGRWGTVRLGSAL